MFNENSEVTFYVYNFLCRSFENFCNSKVSPIIIQHVIQKSHDPLCSGFMTLTNLYLRCFWRGPLPHIKLVIAAHPRSGSGKMFPEGSRFVLDNFFPQLNCSTIQSRNVYSFLAERGQKR